MTLDIRTLAEILDVENSGATLDENNEPDEEYYNQKWVSVESLKEWLDKEVKKYDSSAVNVFVIDLKNALEGAEK